MRCVCIKYSNCGEFQPCRASLTDLFARKSQSLSVYVIGPGPLDLLHEVPGGSCGLIFKVPFLHLANNRYFILPKKSLRP